MIKCNDSNRDRLREAFRLYQKFLVRPTKVSEKRWMRVIQSELPYLRSPLFEKWGSSIGSNKLEYRSVVFNLKDQKNPDFRRKMLLGQIEPERIVSPRLQKRWPMIKEELRTNRLRRRLYSSANTEAHLRPQMINSSVGVSSGSALTTSCKLEVLTNL
ncbi:hypothetical protein Nepgr_032829 [Nepenthes gracilis]|uniref:TFIIS central domain-containing protein n=1 Tax=Nepenthes gracilis TaxID=150966 RepID=A0AAD3TKV0_NEPGR|nr:hypothetical protein Nepgr_032829 [Nepenthes gracilis]